MPQTPAEKAAQTKEEMMKEFDEIAVYTNEYGYPHEIPQFDTIKSLLEKSLDSLGQMRYEEGERSGLSQSTWNMEAWNSALLSLKNALPEESFGRSSAGVCRREGFNYCRLEVLSAIDKLMK